MTATRPAVTATVVSVEWRATPQHTWASSRPANEVVEIGWFTVADCDRVPSAEQEVIDLLVDQSQMAP